MAQERKKHKEADKFVWYSVENGSAIEVQNKKKEVIIPFSAGCTKVEYDYRSTLEPKYRRYYSDNQIYKNGSYVN